jgi:nonribosomal peptide synthetase DhbF
VLARTIEKTGTTILQATPTLWHALTTNGAEGLRDLTMLVGGETLMGRLSLTLRGLGRRVTNLYGPTEATILSAVMVLDDDDAETPPIGRPIWKRVFTFWMVGWSMYLLWLLGSFTLRGLVWRVVILGVVG